MNKWILGLVLLLVMGVGLAYYFGFDHGFEKAVKKETSSFEECVRAGNPVMESYPEQCRDTSGNTFVRDIGNELEYSDLIQVDNPRPNQKITSPLVVTGKARGQWFFEAQFPIELVDENGISLGVIPATAQGEWMTEEFVPFTASLTFSTLQTPKGKLIIRNSNASGLPENEKELVIPVEFKVN